MFINIHGYIIFSKKFGKMYEHFYQSFIFEITGYFCFLLLGAYF